MTWVRKDGPVSVYRLFDETGVLLYVGIANNPERRWRQHRREKSWWSAVTRIEIHEHPTRREAERAEAFVIRIETPAYNIQGHPFLQNWTEERWLEEYEQRRLWRQVHAQDS